MFARDLASAVDVCGATHPLHGRATEGILRTMTETIDYREIGPKIGESFPDVRLPDQSGRVVDLHAARRGRRAAVVFYRSARW